MHLMSKHVRVLHWCSTQRCLKKEMGTISTPGLGGFDTSTLRCNTWRLLHNQTTRRRQEPTSQTLGGLGPGPWQ